MASTRSAGQRGQGVSGRVVGGTGISGAVVFGERSQRSSDRASLNHPSAFRLRYHDVHGLSASWMVNVHPFNAVAI